MAPSKPTGDEDGPWVTAFVLLPVLLVVLLVAGWCWHWRNSATIAETLEAARPAAGVATPAEVRRAAPPLPLDTVTSPGDAGPTAAPTLATLQSLFDTSKLLRRNAAEAAANVDRYCAETAKLPKHVFDDPPDAGPLRDAAYFMEPLVTWDGRPPIEGLLQLPRPLIDRVRAAGDGWASVLTTADTAGVDFAWMAQLQGYDHWSLAAVGATADQAATVDPFNLSIPSYWLLVSYAKLRFVRALAQGDVAAAVTEVQRLADLVHTNGLGIADLYAAQLVALEAQGVGAAAQQGYSALPSATFDSAADDRFHDLLMAGMAFTLPGVDEAVFERAMGCVPDACVAIDEAVSQHREMDRLSERDDDPFWGYAEGHSCDDDLFQLLSHAPAGQVDSLSGYLGGEPLPLEKLLGPGIAVGQ